MRQVLKKDLIEQVERLDVQLSTAKASLIEIALHTNLDPPDRTAHNTLKKLGLTPVIIDDSRPPHAFIGMSGFGASHLPVDDYF